MSAAAAPFEFSDPSSVGGRSGSRGVLRPSRATASLTPTPRGKCSVSRGEAGSYTVVNTGQEKTYACMGISHLYSAVRCVVDVVSTLWGVDNNVLRRQPRQAVTLRNLGEVCIDERGRWGIDDQLLRDLAMRHRQFVLLTRLESNRHSKPKHNTVRRSAAEVTLGGRAGRLEKDRQGRAREVIAVYAMQLQDARRHISARWRSASGSSMTLSWPSDITGYEASTQTASFWPRN